MQQGTENKKQQPHHGHNNENGDNERFGISCERDNGLWHGKVGRSKSKWRDDLNEIS